MKKVFNLLMWMVKSVLFGLVIIFVFNIIGAYINLNVPVNVWTILIIGMLRIPGLALILVFNLL